MLNKRLSDQKLSLILFAAASIWGLYWVPLRALESGGITGAWSVAVFSAFPLLVLIPTVILSGQTQHLKLAALLGGFIGCGMGFYATGLVSTTVVRTTILFYLTPIWSTILGVVWLSERLSVGRVAGIIMGILGLFLLISGQGEDTLPLNIGDFCAFLSGVFWAIGATLIKRYPEVPTVSVTTFQFAASGLIGVILALLLVPGSTPTLESIIVTIPISVSAGVLVLLPSVFIILWISKRLFPGRVGILMMSEALVALVTATLFLPEETMTMMQWAGGAAIIAACVCEVLG